MKKIGCNEIDTNIIGELFSLNWGISMPLTDEEDNLSPTILADGRRIAFMSYRDKFWEGACVNCISCAGMAP